MRVSGGGLICRGMPQMSNFRKMMVLIMIDGHYLGNYNSYAKSKKAKDSS